MKFQQIILLIIYYVYKHVYHCMKLIGSSYESKFTTHMYQKQHDVDKDSNLITIQNQHGI